MSVAVCGWTVRASCGIIGLSRTKFRRCSAPVWWMSVTRCDDELYTQYMVDRCPLEVMEWGEMVKSVLCVWELCHLEYGDRHRAYSNQIRTSPSTESERCSTVRVLPYMPHIRAIQYVCGCAEMHIFARTSPMVECFMPWSRGAQSHKCHTGERARTTFCSRGVCVMAEYSRFGRLLFVHSLP